MPHCVFHATKNIYNAIDWNRLLPAFNQTLCPLDSGFKPFACKGRAICVEYACIGTTEAPVQREYIHIEIAIIAGRSLDLRASISKTMGEWMYSQIQKASQLPVELTVNITELDPTIYVKIVPI